MNPHVNTISNRLSLRPPQRDSLEILARVCEIIPLHKDGDTAQALDIIKSEFSTVLMTLMNPILSWKPIRANSSANPSALAR